VNKQKTTVSGHQLKKNGQIPGFNC